MRVTLLPAAFPDTRSYYAALGRMERDGWDLEAFDGRWGTIGGCDAYHPLARTRREAIVRLAVAGVMLRGVVLVADGAGAEV
jgi:hypothetical protein